LSLTSRLAEDSRWSDHRVDSVWLLFTWIPWLTCWE
jgi:hypothetical protein